MWNEHTQKVFDMVVALKKNVGWIPNKKLMTIFRYAADHNVFVASDDDTYIAVEDEIVYF